MSGGRPNIVLLTIDSLRADHCGCYGYGRNTTPTMDEMAAEGTVFENAISPGPSTPESLPATFTGEYPVASGDGEGLEGTRTQFREHLSRYRTIPEYLGDRGYTTGGFTPNPWTSHHFGFDSGFDHFEDFMGHDRSSGLWERMLEGRGSTPLNALRLLSSWTQRENTFKPWPSMYDDIIGWTETVEGPYFLWVFLMDVHFPYLPDARSRTQSRWRTYEASLRLYLESQTTPYSDRVHDQLVTAYDDAIHYTDRCIARLREALDDATFVVHADHGEGFGEHGTYGHHGQLYDPNVRVPLVVSGEEAAIPDARVETPVSIRSMPSLLQRLADGKGISGVSEETVHTQTGDRTKTAVRGRDWKYIHDGTDGELYRPADGERDPVGDDQLRSDAEVVRAQRLEHDRERARIEDAATAIQEVTR